jgi:Asp-tRNA(Asn)/Glu-tRNA(Gln) amidotransferase A subunit family amidase
VGLQFVGPALGEDKLLQAARSFQQATRWHKVHPPL